MKRTSSISIPTSRMSVYKMSGCRIWRGIPNVYSRHWFYLSGRCKEVRLYF